MKIVYLHQYFNTPQMAGGTRSYEMARRLVAKGHQVDMITSWRDERGEHEGGWFESEEEGIHVHWLPIPYSNTMSYSQRVRAFAKFAWAASRKAASMSADIIFATSTPLTIAIPGAYAKWRLKVPMVFEVRDLWPELPIAVGALGNPLTKTLALKLEHFAYNASSHIVALSPGMRDGVVRTGYPSNKVSIIPNSSDLELFDPSNAEPDNFLNQHPELKQGSLVVYTGTMGIINGVEYLPQIAAAARTQGLGIQFAVVGRGIGESKVKEKAQELSVLGDNFHLYDSAPKAEMPSILAAADIALSLFVDLKPMWANSANKFFDALASGTPVAINYGGWQAAALSETGAGIQIPPDDPDEAARQLGELLGDQNRLAKAARAARGLAEERFSRDKLADQLESVFLDAISPSTTSKPGFTSQ